jgi:predicted nucleic acid-binding protein
VTVTIVDSGFIYAIFDSSDGFHSVAISLISDSAWRFYVPTVTLVEVFKLMTSKERNPTQGIGFKVKQFAQGLRDISEKLPFELDEVTPSDHRRVVELLDAYADSGIDYVDAVVVAIAERYHTPYIMTVDQRHFRIYRPNFEPHTFILPMFDDTRI